MSKLLEDPKIAVLVEKAEKCAIKTETKRVLELIKSQLDANKETEDKFVKKTVSEILKRVTHGIKNPV